MATAPNQPRQVELVLENRQVMGVFLVMAVLCGIFFALGFVVGKSTSSGSGQSTEAVDENLPPADKPSAMSTPAYIPKSQQATVAGEPDVQQAAADTDLSFYNNVQTNAPDGPAESEAAQKQAPSAPPVGPAPEGIVVQVSALTRRGDAENLLNLLKEKNLPVLVTTGASDSLFHVVVGPYKSEKDAEQVKQSLEKDGFRPFIRR
jgi:cell division septation protein DedD